MTNWFYASVSWIGTRPSRFCSPNLLFTQNANVNFPALRGFSHFEPRQWSLWVAGVVAAQFSAIKREQNVSCSKTWRGCFLFQSWAAGVFSFDRTAAYLACFTARRPTWRGVKLYFQTPKAFPPPPLPHSIVYLLSSSFYGTGIGLFAPVCSSSCKKNTSTLHTVRKET